jgi:myosin heavy subunit
MVKNRNYLSALEEIEKTLNDDARFDDREIVEELATWKTLIASYKQQLQELDVTEAQLADYKKIYEQNGRLAGDNHQLTRMFFVFYQYIESLAECRDRLAKEQEEVQTTHDQLEKTRSKGYVITDIEELAECRAQRAAEQTAAQRLQAQHNQTLRIFVDAIV